MVGSGLILVPGVSVWVQLASSAVGAAVERVLVDVCLIHVFDDVDLTGLVGYDVSTAVDFAAAGDERIFSPLRYSASWGCKVKPGVNLCIRSTGGGNEPNGYVRETISVKSLIPDAGVYSLQKAGQTDGP